MNLFCYCPFVVRFGILVTFIKIYPLAISISHSALCFFVSSFLFLFLTLEALFWERGQLFVVFQGCFLKSQRFLHDTPSFLDHSVHPNQNQALKHLLDLKRLGMYVCKLFRISCF